MSPTIKWDCATARRRALVLEDVPNRQPIVLGSKSMGSNNKVSFPLVNCVEMVAVEIAIGAGFKVAVDRDGGDFG